MPKIVVNYQNRNRSTLLSFMAFCEKHPQLRFWQALTAWAGYWRIDAVPMPETMYSGGEGGRIDTFYWEGRDHDNV